MRRTTSVAGLFSILAAPLPLHAQLSQPIPETLLEQPFVIPWVKLMHQEIKDILARDAVSRRRDTCHWGNTKTVMQSKVFDFEG